MPNRPDTPCKSCGVLCWRPKTHSGKPLCRKCRARARLLFCAWCRKPFRVRWHPERREHCSADCRELHRIFDCDSGIEGYEENGVVYRGLPEN